MGPIPSARFLVLQRSRLGKGVALLMSAIALSQLLGCITASSGRRDEPSNQVETKAHVVVVAPMPANKSQEITPAIAEKSSQQSIGTSTNGKPIVLYQFASANPAARNILLFAGIHGDEGTTVGVTRKFVAELHANPPALDVNLYVIPLANPDGFAAKSRTNANKVDLNRNFPAVNWKTSQRKTQYWNGPSPLSEPESLALHDLVLKLKPIRILSMHSIKAGRHGNNYDGPAEYLAALLASKNQYNVLPTMGYPTPGSFGSWAGIDLNIPTITLELPSNVSSDVSWKQNREALWAFVRGK